MTLSYFSPIYIGILLFLIGVLLLVRHRRLMKKYLPIPVHVTAVKLGEDRNSMSPRYKVSVTYEFAVKDKTYTGRKLTRTEGWGNKKAMQKSVNHLQGDAPTQGWYNPQDPYDTFLKADPPWTAFALMGLGVFCAGVLNVGTILASSGTFLPFMGKLLGRLFLAFLYLFIPGAVFFTARNQREEQKRKMDTFEPVEVEMQSATVLSYSSENSRSYYPSVSYTYAVGGNYYSGNNFSPLPWRTRLRHECEQAVADFSPVGAKKMGYYNPRKPQESYLVQKQASGLDATMMVSAAVGGLIFFCTMMGGCGAP